MNGMLVIDKPKGLTSAQVVGIIKKRFNLKKVGHGGTLDPLATGVLPIFINQATKLSSYLLNSDKVYEGTFLLGVETDTQDICGRIIAENSVVISDLDIQEAMKTFLGPQQQLPPMYSAIKKKGKPLYHYARKQQEVERMPRPIHIFDFEFLSRKDKEVDFRVHCSKGTYVRTLCSDLGKKLGTYACVKDLKRIRTDILSMEEAIEFEKLNSQNVMFAPHYKDIKELYNRLGTVLKKQPL